MTQTSDLVLDAIPSPCFVLEEVSLEQNLAVFERVQREAPVKVLLALKAFSLFHCCFYVRCTMYYP